MDKKFIEATNFVARGSMRIRRSALPLSDPESWVSLWQKKYGDLEEFPWEETYGRYPTFDGRCECCGRHWRISASGHQGVPNLRRTQ